MPEFLSNETSTEVICAIVDFLFIHLPIEKNECMNLVHMNHPDNARTSLFQTSLFIFT